MADIGFQDQLSEDGKRDAKIAAKTAFTAAQKMCVYFIRQDKQKQLGQEEIIPSGRMSVKDFNALGKEVDIAELDKSVVSDIKRILDRSGIDYAIDAVKINEEKMIRLYFEKKDVRVVDKMMDDIAKRMAQPKRESVISKISKLVQEIAQNEKTRNREKHKEQDIGAR